MRKLFIFGAGYSGQAIGRAADFPSYGTSRDEKRFSHLQAAGITPLLFDGRSLTAEIKAALAETSHLVISIAPDETGDPVLRLGSFPELKILMPKLQWIAYLSTVGVYGDHQGRLIDERAICTPSNQRNQIRLDVEARWQAFAHFTALPLSILRLAGIYGPGRNAFVKLQEGRAHRIIKENQIFNRIHADDIAGALLHLARNNIGGIFNISDDEPAPPQDVIAYAAKLMGVAPPAAIAFEQATLSPMARSFYADNRRISNKKLRASGYQLIHPNYRQALGNMWQQDTWH